MQASNPSVAQIGNQMEASDDTAGNNAEGLSLRNDDIPSSSLKMEETKIEVSSDKGPLCSLPAPGEPKDCLTGEEGCSDATEVSHFTPMLYLL